jgi:hypothetical protein
MLMNNPGQGEAGLKKRMHDAAGSVKNSLPF